MGLAMMPHIALAPPVEDVFPILRCSTEAGNAVLTPEIMRKALLVIQARNAKYQDVYF